MRLAVVPGSFDPITVGHVNVIERAAKLFDVVVVAVMMNPDKEYMFDINQRAQLAKISCAHIPNVEVLASEGMLYDVTLGLGACAIVKGLRSGKDYYYEQKMAVYNREKNPAAETVYLPSDAKFRNVSSTIVRRRIFEQKPLDGYMMPDAIKKLETVGFSVKEKKSEK